MFTHITLNLDLEAVEVHADEWSNDRRRPLTTACGAGVQNVTKKACPTM